MDFDGEIGLLDEFDVVFSKLSGEMFFFFTFTLEGHNERSETEDCL